MEQTFIHTLHPVQVKELVRAWLREDTPHFDFGGYVVGENKEKAQLLGKSAGILAGKPFVDAVFRELDCDVEWLVSEGEEIQPVRIIAIVTGKARNLLLGERVALNCIARTSGIATYCQKLRNMAVDAKWHGRIAGTRKTTPGFRLAEKYAMIVGGVDTHRYDLSSMIMLKDNHIESVGCIEKAVNNAKLVGGFSLKVEVECRSLQEALEAAKSKADIIMLDNFKHQDLHIAARQIKLQYPNVIIEASGGITESNIHKYFGSDIDIISLSRISQGYSVVDFSLKIIKSENKISLLPKSTST